MDPTAGLHPCANCGNPIWAESPCFPLCEKCGAAQAYQPQSNIQLLTDQPATPASSELTAKVEGTSKPPAVKRPRGRSAAAKSEKD